MLSSVRSCSLWLMHHQKQHINKQQSVFSTLSKSIHNLQVTPLPQVSVEEKRHSNVGITEFVGCHPKLTARIKESNSDFHVHEIDINGRLVKLTDFGPPPATINAEGFISSKQKYIHCTLYKEGTGMAEAIQLIAKKLRVSPNRFKWAGRKDRDGKTCQRISILNVEAHHLLRVSTECKKVKLGNFVHAGSPLSLGQLRGNHFKLLLKNVQLPLNDSIKNFDTPNSALRGAMKSLKENGFINYFGLQRFGNSASVPTHCIGKAVLQMDWEEVFDLILAPKPTDTSHIQKLKKIWLSSRDLGQIAELRRNSKNDHEPIDVSTLLDGLARHYKNGEGDFHAAFLNIPKTVRSLFIPSFISFLWNHIATFRLQKFRLTPSPGDFVYTVRPFDDPSLCSNYSVSSNAPYSATKDSWKWEQVQMLTEENVDKYSIEDVLLPVPGIKIPKYHPAVQEYYESFLQELGLNVDCYSKYLPSSDQPKGFYRSLVVKPQNIDYKIIPYRDSDNLDKYIPSDLDLLLEDEENPLNLYQSPMTTEITQGKDKICAIIEFSLPTASYATMTLREILWDNEK